MSTSSRWTPDSWRQKPIEQMPAYPDEAASAGGREGAGELPAAGFCRRGARADGKALGEVAAGRAFMLQGGDCAETFSEHGADPIRDFFRVFLQMAVVLTFAASRPVVKIGRIAGQFAKPRSADWKRMDGVELPSYRGDIINDIAFTARGAYARSAPDAQGLPAIGGDAQFTPRLRARRLCGPGAGAPMDARLRRGQPRRARYEELANRISETLNFMRACGITSENSERLRDHRFLHEPRSAAAPLRGGLRADRFDQRQPLRDLGPLPLDRRPHAPAGSCACRIPARHQEPHRREVRAEPRSRGADRAHRHPEPGERARPPDADLPLSARTRSANIFPISSAR